MAAVYQIQPIKILAANPDYRWNSAELAHNLVAIDSTFAQTGTLTSTALFLLQNEILRRTVADGLRRCLVVSPTESYFCESDGTIYRASTQPTGGLRLDKPPMNPSEFTKRGQQ